jgi:hypothetical protein
VRRAPINANFLKSALRASGSPWIGRPFESMSGQQPGQPEDVATL